MPFHLVGIDEAGYGPQLGPLVVSAAVFELPDIMMAGPHSGPVISCLWKKFPHIIANGKSRDKIAVCDSKALYQPAAGLKELEKTALVFKRLVEPNYRSHNGITLPLSANDNEINRLTKALRSEFNKNSIRFCEVRASIVEPPDFNAGIRRLGNKADFLWEISGGLIKYCLDKYRHSHTIVIRAGKQGGRNYYLSYIQGLLADKIIRAREQGCDASSYTIRISPSSGAVISFIRDGDASEFAIALASIFSKYYRELAMFKLNNFFRSHIPALEPTSGYHTDSRRFLKKVNPLFGKLHLDRNNFIRIK